MLPFFVQLLQLPAVIVVERIRGRRKICVWASGVGRSFLLATAVAPLFAASAGMAVFIVPEREQGRFFGRRTAAATALATMLVLLGGGFLEI